MIFLEKNNTLNYNYKYLSTAFKLTVLVNIRKEKIYYIIISLFLRTIY